MITFLLLYCVVHDLAVLLQCFPDRAASRELSVLVVTCPNNCSWEGQYQDYPAHYTVCPRRPTRCPHPSCSMNLPLEELEHHKTTCPYKPVKCRYCYQELQVDEVKVRMMGESEWEDDKDESMRG